MRVGILGSGLMGGKLGTIFARAGHEVTFSYARSRKKLDELAREAGARARADTPGGAAEHADALLLAVHWSRFDDVLKQTGNLAGKVVVTCSLPMNDDDSGLVVGLTSSGAETLAKRIPKAWVVCAFNTVPSEVLFDVYESGRGDDAGCLCCGRAIPGAHSMGDLTAGKGTVNILRNDLDDLTQSPGAEQHRAPDPYKEEIRGHAGDFRATRAREREAGGSPIRIGCGR